MVTAIGIGAVICIITTMAGDMSQDLKTGFLVGATPKKQQIGELIGAVAAAFAIGGILYLLNSAWGFGSQELPAPQAMMMKMVVEGVMEGNLPWTLIVIGMFISIVLELLRVPALPVAIGLYLPIHLSSGIMVGGVAKLIVEKRKYRSEADRDLAEETGVLWSSGLIAGEGIIGVVLAVLAVIHIGGRSVLEIINLSGSFSLGNLGGLAAYLLLAVIMFVMIGRQVRKSKGTKEQQ